MSVNTLEASEGPVLIAVAPGEIAARSPMQLFWRRFRSDKVAIVALVFIVCLIVVAIALLVWDFRPLPERVTVPASVAHDSSVAELESEC